MGTTTRSTSESPTSPAPLSDRALRQRELVPPAALAACHALVVGVGAIGRQVALQLAALGIPLLILCDYDAVEEVNLAPQGYRPDQLGLQKVDATAADCRQINPEVHVLVKEERFRRSLADQFTVGSSSLAVFACVDSIGTRRLLWEALRRQAALFVDGRMSAEVLRVLAANDPGSDGYYATTLFNPEQAYAGSCTARSTIYTASIAGGLMVGQFSKWLRGLPVDSDVTVNLLAAEWHVAGPNAR